MLKKLGINTDRLFERLRFISIKIVFFVILFLGAVYTVIWLYISYQTTDKMINFIDLMRYKNINIAIDDYESFGFPDQFSTKIDNLVYLNKRRSFGWKTSDIVIYPPFLDTSSLIIDISDDHFFSIRDSINNIARRIALRNKLCQAKITFDNGAIDHVSLKAQKGALQFFQDKKTYSYDHLEFDLKSSKVLLEDRLEDILEFNMNVHNIRPNNEWKRILEDNFIYYKTNFYLRNPSFFHELPNFERYIVRNYDMPEIIINDMELKHRLSQFNLSGILMFDSDLELNGHLILRVSNYQKLLSFLTKKGVITDEVATNFRFILSFISSTKILEKNDGSVDIPLTVKKNIIYKDNIPIYSLNL